MRLNKEIIIDYIHTTKLGNFIALMLFAVVIELPVLFMSIEYFKAMLCGSLMMSMFLSIFNGKERWI